MLPFYQGEGLKGGYELCGFGWFFFFFFKQVNFTNKPYTTITKSIKGCKKSGIVWKEIADQNTRPSSPSQEKKSV